MQSPRFITTDRNDIHNGDYFESRALALAFAIVGRLIAEEFLKVDFSQPEWETTFKHTVQAAADVIHQYEVDG